MARFVTRNLMTKLVTVFMLVTLIPIAIVGFLSFYSARSSLEQAEFNKLDTIKDEKLKEISAYLREAVGQMYFLARTNRVSQGFDLLSPQKGDSGSAVANTGSEAELAALDRAMISVDATFEGFVGAIGGQMGFEDLLMIDEQSGRVLYTTNKLSDLNADVKTGNLSNSELRKAWDAVVKTRKQVITDFSIYPPTNSPALFIGVPVFRAADQKFIGVLVARLSANKISEIMKVTDAAGKTTEVYLVGSDKLMRSDSRYEKESTVLKKRIDTEPVRLAFQDKSGDLVTTDARGVPVYASYSHAGLNEDKDLGMEAEWAAVAEVSVSEAVQAAKHLAYRTLLIATAVGLLVILIAYFVVRSLAKPITALSEQVDKASRGDLTVEIPATNRHDELGVLAQAIKSMVGNLRRQVGQVLEAANVVASASSEISATAAQVAASTSKTTAAVTQSATTAEEVRQAAKMVGEKAKEVARSAQQAVEVSTNGREATQDTVGKMNLIRDQMESIGETVVRLSDHSQAIEHIISTVQDIADQSNLLAVNASIEAARAGDQGKGFAVVAQEIKSLADQSKQSTEQVRGILDDTRKWVAAVVMATEQGGKAVDAGVRQASSAGDSIKSLSEGVHEWTQAASLVDASSAQQAVGAEQVSSAMRNIEQAMQQVLDGVSQLETAARRLEDLSKSVTDLLSGYTV